MSMVGFPLLLIPLAVVNIIVFLMPGVSFTDPIVTLTLMSKAAWKVTFGDVLLALGMLLLLFEVIKAARPGGKYLTDHLLALLVLAGAAAEFVLLPQFATSVFFLLTVLTLVDFLAGVSLRLRRENRRAAANTAPSKASPSNLPVAPQAQAEPVMPPPMATIEPAHQAPTQVAPEGTPVQAVSIPGHAAPDVTAPDLQPGSPPSADGPTR
jgi:hypothetical protein